MTSKTEKVCDSNIQRKQRRKRYLKLVNGGELASCIASSIEEACELLGQEHFSRINDHNAICMASPGQSIEVHLEATAFDWAQKEGQQAYQLGEPETANPYAPTTRQHKCWCDGWTAAYEDTREENNAVH